MTGVVHTENTPPADDFVWIPVLRLPEVAELRHRRRLVTGALGGLTVAMFTAFLVAFVAFPDRLGTVVVLGVPLSLWVVLSQFAGTWALVWAYFRLSRTYIRPAADAAIRAVTAHRTDGEEAA